MKAATDRTNEVPIAITPTFALASPNRHPASPIIMLASRGNSGIRT